MLISSLSVTAMSISAFSAPASMSVLGCAPFPKTVRTSSRSASRFRVDVCSSTTVMSFFSSARCSASVPPTCPAPRIMIFTGLWTLPTTRRHLKLSQSSHAMWISHVSRANGMAIFLKAFVKEKRKVRHPRLCEEVFANPLVSPDPEVARCFSRCSRFPDRTFQ